MRVTTLCTSFSTQPRAAGSVVVENQIRSVGDIGRLLSLHKLLRLRRFAANALLLVASCGWALAASGEPLLVKVWPAGAPGAIAKPGYTETVEHWNNDPAWPLAKRVSDATLEVFLPEKPSLKGTAVVICPGGGYYSLNFKKEGRDVARWFSDRGVVGIVLKYRLPSSEIMTDKSIAPLQDVQEALRIVRRRAKEWGIQPDRIGVCGFSAGGHVAAIASTLYGEKPYAPSDAVSARPDFTILVYPLISLRPEIAPRGLTHDLIGETPSTALIDRLSAELHVTADTPPTFLVHAKDDQAVSPEHSIRYAHALQEHGVPVELHLYEKGNHGFGLGLFPDSPKIWTEALKDWMKSRDLL